MTTAKSFTGASRRGGLKGLVCNLLFSKSDFDGFDVSPITSLEVLRQTGNYQTTIARNSLPINRMPRRRRFLNGNPPGVKRAVAASA